MGGFYYLLYHYSTIKSVYPCHIMFRNPLNRGLEFVSIPDPFIVVVNPNTNMVDSLVSHLKFS